MGNTTWRDELSRSIIYRKELSSVIDLSEEELRFFSENRAEVSTPPLRVPPRFLSCLQNSKRAEQLRRQFIPSAGEFICREYESSDPLKERLYSPTPRLIHRYPDRVLLLTTGECAVLCRFCFRRRLAEEPLPPLSEKELAEAAEYVDRSTDVREVIFSGGDPLTLDDGPLESILHTFGNLREKRVVPLTIRIATRVPAALPSRITSRLCSMLRKYVPLFIVLHCNHPDELSEEGRGAVSSLVDAGLPVVSQSVLLKGVNDDPEVLTELFSELVSLRVKPYYLFQTDLASGTSHFRVPLAESFQIVRQVRYRVSGLAMPSFAMDIPEGGGKIVLSEKDPPVLKGGMYIFRGEEGRAYRYPAD